MNIVILLKNLKIKKNHQCLCPRQFFVPASSLELLTRAASGANLNLNRVSLDAGRARLAKLLIADEAWEFFVDAGRWVGAV